MNTRKSYKPWMFILQLILAWAMATGVIFYLQEVKESYEEIGFLEAFTWEGIYLNRNFYIVFAAVLFIILMLTFFGEQIGQFVYKFRYPLCAIVFILK